MKIIDSNGKKDYYDYLQNIKGVDPLVTYDRRGSTVIGESEHYIFDWPSGFDAFFCKKPFKEDKPKEKKKIWHSKKYENRFGGHTWSWKGKTKYVEEGTIYHLFLEVGCKQFLFEVERYLDENNNVQIDVSLVNTKEVSKEDKKSSAPMFLSEFSYDYSRRGYSSNGIENPILRSTWIPKLIPAEDMWNMLYEYISSLNDKEFTDSRTNDQHIESHGFDKKISFRHRKKNG